MRITKIEGYPEWPITFTCPVFKVTYELSLPNDMRIKQEYTQKIVEDTVVKTIIKETVVFECPICGNLHEIDKSKIPPIIRNRIPILKV